MTQLAAPRDTPRREGRAYRCPVGDRVVWQGALTALDVNGKAVPAAANPALICLGRAEATARPGDDASISRGVFLWGNAGDVTRAQIGKAAYAVDDQTVSADPKGNPATRPAAGRIFDVVPGGVWVEI